MVMDLFLLLLAKWCFHWDSRVFIPNSEVLPCMDEPREACDSCMAEEASLKAFVVSFCLPDLPEHEFH